MTNGIALDKNEINLRNLFIKAKKGDKSFLYYNNSKSKINAIIRKNQLPNFVIEYLWQSKIYKKELIRNQKTLPQSVREDIINKCTTALVESPWTSILRNFLKFHNPTDKELQLLVGTPINKLSGTHDSIILECWEAKPEDCHRLQFDDLLYSVIVRNSVKNGSIHKQIVNIISYILTSLPEMQKQLLDEILSTGNDFVVRNLLKPAFKITPVNDFTVDYLLTHSHNDTFKDIIKYAMHRENISNNMMAKIYLAID